MGLLKRLFCRHGILKYNRTLYGDEINYHNGKRYEYICQRCGAYIYSTNYVYSMKSERNVSNG